MELERSSKKMKEISMVPLINVVFLLLIFFLVAGTIEKFDVVPIELPQAVSGQVLDEGNVTILLGQYDEIIINDAFVMPEDIQKNLQKALAEDSKQVITIKADMRLSATKLIDFMDKVKAAGGENISLITQKDG